jgi:hypothetical protein
MSNGIGKNPLLDISKVYLDQVAEKKDDSYLEPDMKKRQKNNEKARKDMEKMGTSMKNPHFEETQVAEKLDPVGKEDGDVNNDGKKDSSDSYLMKRRKAIGSAMKKKLKESRSLAEVMTDTEDDKPIKEKKISNKIKINPKLGEAVEELGGELLEMTEVDEAVYGGTPPEKKDTRMTVTNADKKGNTPAYQAYKAGNKKYKAADHMNEGDGDPCWDSHKQVGMKKKGGKMVPNCVPKNEEVETEVEEGYKELSRGKRNTMFRKAGNLSRTALQGGDKGTEAGKKSGKIVKALNKDAEKYDRNDVKEDASMTPQELQLQKKKAMIDRMIAQRRQQGLNKAKKSEAPTKAMGEETEDSLKDRRMERGGVDGNNRYKSATKNVAMGGGKKKPYDGMSALEKVKASIRAKHGQGAIMDTKKK